MEKPYFIHGMHKRSKMYHGTAYVVLSYINRNREEIKVTTTSQYKQYSSIDSVEPTIPKRQEKFTCMQTLTAKPGNFITLSPFLSVKSMPVPMTIMESGYLYTVPSALTIHQTWTVGLGLLEDDRNDRVGGHAGRDFFHSSNDFKRWTLQILANHSWILKSAGIYDTVGLKSTFAWMFSNFRGVARRILYQNV